MHRLDWVSLRNLGRGDSRGNNTRSPGSSDLPKPARRSIRLSIEGSDEDGPEGQGSRYRRWEWRDRSGVSPALGSSGRKNCCWLQQQIRPGRCDVLVNSAGFTRIPHHDLEALTDELIDSIFAANVRGPFATIRAFAPLMKKAAGAVIVNISSIAAIVGTGSNIPMAARKPLWTPWRCRWRGSWGPKSGC